MGEKLELKYKVILFDSTNHAIRAEKILKESSSVKMRIVPVPKKLSANCGICIRFLVEDLQEIENILKKKEIVYKNISNL